jgi:hypothetical protein
MGNPNGRQRNSIADCYACGASLADGEGDPVDQYVPEVTDWVNIVSRSVSADSISPSAVAEINVMRQLALILTSRFPALSLHAHLCNVVLVSEMPLAVGTLPIESRVLKERHHLIQLVGWLMLDLEPRLRNAWRANAVRYNHLLKDFARAPQFYLTIVDGFSDWRSK